MASWSEEEEDDLWIKSLKENVWPRYLFKCGSEMSLLLIVLIYLHQKNGSEVFAVNVRIQWNGQERNLRISKKLLRGKEKDFHLTVLLVAVGQSSTGTLVFCIWF